MDYFIKILHNSFCPFELPVYLYAKNKCLCTDVQFINVPFVCIWEHLDCWKICFNWEGPKVLPLPRALSYGHHPNQLSLKGLYGCQMTDSDFVLEISVNWIYFSFQQTRGENAPWSLAMRHFTELREKKGLCCRSFYYPNWLKFIYCTRDIKCKQVVSGNWLMAGCQ